MGEANKAAKPRKPHALSREQPTDYCRRADSLLWGHLRPGCNGKISCPCPLGSAGSSRGLRRKAGCPQGQLSPETSLAPAFHAHPECRASSPAVSNLQHTQHGTCQQGSQGKSFWMPMTCHSTPCPEGRDPHTASLWQAGRSHTCSQQKRAAGVLFSTAAPCTQRWLQLLLPTSVWHRA